MYRSKGLDPRVLGSLRNADVNNMFLTIHDISQFVMATLVCSDYVVAFPGKSCRVLMISELPSFLRIPAS